MASRLLLGSSKTVNRQLTQQEIDAVFQKVKGTVSDSAKKAVAFDFRRPDRIAKSQVRAIHLLHENFVRNLASSLSAYLRSYLTVNLISLTVNSWKVCHRPPAWSRSACVLMTAMHSSS
ncbi:hypothetical protein SBA3_1750012 [Candidatus Sulfopaludibacter sp. SbA3]|nr:hypothetical protein SBA3_1750012 [Candidatus Sulfopaludibacter sp. SbA3]